MYLSLQGIINFSLLLTLFMYICALLGMQLFSYECRFDTNGEIILNIVEEQKKGTTMLYPRQNFDTIVAAMTTVFIIIIGEDWPNVMYNYVRVYDMGPDNSGAAGWAISLFFIFVYSVGNFLLLSLFVAILLQNFNEEKVEEKLDDEFQEEKITMITADSANESQTSGLYP